MPRLNDVYTMRPELVLGTRLNSRVPEADQVRQRTEVEELLRRLRKQPGVILADEVGMGKTFVALAVAYSVAMQSPRGPVIVMVPANLVDKWEQDLKSFCELYLVDRHPVRFDKATKHELVAQSSVRYGVARHSIELMRLLDDVPRQRCHLIFLAQGAMGRRQTDKWIRLALIAEALRRHSRGRASRLIQVKSQIHRFLGELLWALGEERATDWGADLWQSLLRSHPDVWKQTFNDAVRDKRRQLADDPVPKSVTRALAKTNLAALAQALEQVPVRAQGGDTRISERVNVARKALRDVETRLWKGLLAQARWRSPLLVMDEAHHLKNPATALAKQLQSADMDQDLRTGDGAMAKAFDRMLFLTATPFQLGHRELTRVLERFGDVKWDSRELGEEGEFHQKLKHLSQSLDESQRTAIALQRGWKRLRPEDVSGDLDTWWSDLLNSPREALTSHQHAVVDAYCAAERSRSASEEALRPWLLRHNKGQHWTDTAISRRSRIDGAAISGDQPPGGLSIPPRQLLPFFLAARSVINPREDLLGEALCSSYEAFRLTRRNRAAGTDDGEETAEVAVDLSQSRWYLAEFDSALERCSGLAHPKVDATVRKVVDLWETGEKVLVFAFYRETCAALRIHISQEIERRNIAIARRRLSASGRMVDDRDLERLLERIHKRYFDDPKAPGRRALDSELSTILQARSDWLDKANVDAEQRTVLIEVMRRFLRVPTTLIRCFPIQGLEAMAPDDSVAQLLNYEDGSGVSWRAKFDGFIQFVTADCPAAERQSYVDAVRGTRTGGIRVAADGAESAADPGVVTVANVQVATGETHRDTRARLMRAFNTPFFPDILVCSQVMGEGVDLQRFCRHVIHHDLAWNPSSIEQRTGRVDRLGCKAEGRQPIMVYLPYLAGAADERQYQVMSEREQWFRVVMGQDEVARLITPDSDGIVELPDAIKDGLSFDLGVVERRGVS